MRQAGASMSDRGIDVRQGRRCQKGATLSYKRIAPVEAHTCCFLHLQQCAEFMCTVGSLLTFACKCWGWRNCSKLAHLYKISNLHHSSVMCGAGMDACEDACQRAVCANMHQVPAWNDACLRKCTSECARGRAA